MSDVREGELLAGKYRVERVLGEGGMGRVVAAVHEQLHQKVAIKFLLPEAISRPEAVERFLREARASVKLKSEHVGRVIDVGTLEDGAPYMVMEYLEGTDLDDLLGQRRALPPVEAIDYLLQACEAIAEAHSHGLIHRDIKPANLFLTRRADGAPLIKVLDFGIAKAAPSDPSFNMTQTQSVMGSPGYMSPEQIRSSRRVDARSDIWSLGVVLFELLSGRKPFSGESFSDLCINVATEPAAPLSVPGLASDLVRAVERCLEKDPANRFQNVAELAFALEPFAHTGRGAASRISRVLQIPNATAQPTSGSVPRHAQPTTLSSAASVRRHATEVPSSRHPWRVGIGAAGVLGLAVVVIAALSGGSQRATSPAAQDTPLEASRSDASTSNTSLPASSGLVDASVAKAISSTPDAGPEEVDAAPITPDAAPSRPTAKVHRSRRNRSESSRKTRATTSRPARTRNPPSVGKRKRPPKPKLELDRRR